MNVSNMYKKLKQILEDSNRALINRNLGEASGFKEIVEKIESIDINRLSYFLKKNIISIIESDLDGLRHIEDGAFYQYGSLKDITIPNSVISIGDTAFYECSSLTNVTIPNSVTSIGRATFSGCSNLTNVTIPNSVISIGDSAFYYCSSLTDIYVNSIIPPNLDGAMMNTTTPTIHVPIGSGDAYKAATNWSRYASHIVEDIAIEDATE